MVPGVIMTGAGIGADLRVERRVAPGDPAAQPLDHRGDDMVGPDAQPVLQRLQRQMPVADMPRDAQQIGRCFGGDLEHRLGGGANPDIAAIIEFEPVAVAHMLRPRQIEQKRRARIGDEPDPAAVPVEKRQRHRIDRGLVRPMSARVDRNGPPHASCQANLGAGKRRTGAAPDMGGRAYCAMRMAPVETERAVDPIAAVRRSGFRGRGPSPGC